MSATLPVDIDKAFALVAQTLRKHNTEAHLRYKGRGDFCSAFLIPALLPSGARVKTLDPSLQEAIKALGERIIGLVHPSLKKGAGGGGDLSWMPDGLLLVSRYDHRTGSLPQSFQLKIASASAAPSTSAETLGINARRVLDAVNALHMKGGDTTFRVSWQVGHPVLISGAGPEIKNINLDLWRKEVLWGPDTNQYQENLVLKRMNLDEAMKIVAVQSIIENFGHAASVDGLCWVTFDAPQESIRAEYMDEPLAKRVYSHHTMVDPSLDNAQVIALLSKYNSDIQEFYPLNAAQQSLHEKMRQQGSDALLLECSMADTPPEDAHTDAPRG